MSKQIEATSSKSQSKAIKIPLNLFTNTENTLKMQKSLLKKDFSAIITDYKTIKKQSEYTSQAFYSSIEDYSNNFLITSEKLLLASILIPKLIEVIQLCKSENMGLREKIFFVQKNLPFYIPEKGDPIDFAMAEYVNSLKFPLKIPFVREEQGTYLFGSKNVKIKYQNKKLFIVAFNSNIAIEEFVAKNTQEEEKILEQHKKLEKMKNLNLSKISNSGSNEELSPFAISPVNTKNLNTSILLRSTSSGTRGSPLGTAENSFISTSPTKLKKGYFSNQTKNLKKK